MDKYTQEMHHKDRPVRGADLPQSERPGVPMEHSPRPLTPTAHWDEPPRMAPRRGIVHRKEIDQMTPVFGTAQPLHGLSGLVRRLAYSISETKARRWLLLLMADRIDVVEHGVGKLLKVAAIGTAGAAGLLLLSRALKT